MLFWEIFNLNFELISLMKMIMGRRVGGKVIPLLTAGYIKWGSDGYSIYLLS